MLKDKEKKIQVGILGATGMVGQKFVELLNDHPWFEIAFLGASEKSQGKKYKEAADWRMQGALCQKVAHLEVSSCDPALAPEIVFSALDSDVAGEIEERFAKAGHIVFSNAKNHRMNPNIPLVIPEVNGSHLDQFAPLSPYKGRIITNPNCSVIGLSIALKPLVDLFGIESAHVTTLQAISGAGYPGVASFDIVDNVIPFIAGEEEKIEKEPLKIFGTFHQGQFNPHQMKLSAHANRVGVVDGHTACLSVKLSKPATEEAIIEAWSSFQSMPQVLNLPSAPKHPIRYFYENHYPQPKLHRSYSNGMGVSIGRLRRCPLYDWKFVILSHNTVRGAAGGALLNAELYNQGKKR